MPLAAIPAIVGASLIGGGATIGATLLSKRASDNAAKKQAETMNPLIQTQADASKWSLDQAKIDIPKARETLSGPLAFWNKILSGDRNAAMGVAGPSADQLASQTAAANRTQTEFAPRGGRRTLMVGDKPVETMTALNRGLLALRPTAAEETKSIGQILASLGLGEENAANQAGASAISGQGDLGRLALAQAAQSGAVLNNLGSGIGDILRLLILSKGGNTAAATTMPGNTGWSTSLLM